jgi:polyferredoxin
MYNTGETMSGTQIQLIVFGSFFVISLIFARLWCGRICPLGIIQDLLFKIPIPLKIRTFRADKYLRFLKYINLIEALAAVALFIGVSEVLIKAAKGVESVTPTIGACTLVLSIVLAVILHRPWCKYFCIPGALQSLGGKISFYKYKASTERCIQCKKCVKVCKMDIEPYKVHNSLECIRCGKCKKVCPKGVFLTGFKPGE